ncbi:hypothetical protein EYF80_052658 [Liparis tanakae]|uniref:Uncharacterized protein n=1 Tax=Liparis tanakae TaxID=230148 RepID=A0A4Z2F8H5_9TELE|nr:hypothetical protein EYF80_052658 [Liparis tanakae]
MISRSMACCSLSLLMAANEIHRLLVLKILNLETDLNSSTWALGTWAISRRRSFPSYWISATVSSSSRQGPHGVAGLVLDTCAPGPGSQNMAPAPPRPRPRSVEHFPVTGSESARQQICFSFPDE